MYYYLNFQNMKVRSAVGTVVVNLDSVPPVDGHIVAMQRATKDAEIAAAVLVFYWLKDFGQPGICTALRQCLQDLSFSGRRMGTGSAFLIEVLKYCDEEDASRKVIGASAARKCRLVANLCGAIMLEDPTKKDADACYGVFKEKKCDASWSAETIRRYQDVGKRLENPKLASLMETWEFHFGRDALLDKITNLRSFFSACGDDDQAHGPMLGHGGPGTR